MVTFSPSTIPASGAGNSTMTIAAGLNTPTGTYPITVTLNKGGKVFLQETEIPVSELVPKLTAIAQNRRCPRRSRPNLAALCSCSRTGLQ